MRRPYSIVWLICGASALAGCQVVLGIEDVAPTSAGDPIGGLDTAMRRRITLAPPPLQGALENVPIAVILKGDQALPAAALDSERRIAFTADDAATPLAHEIEAFDADTGSLTAWVRVPRLSPDSTTDIFLYYGPDIDSASNDPVDTWPDPFSSVWHLGEEPAGGAVRFADSTDSGTDAIAANDDTRPGVVPGIAGPALSFDGDDCVRQGMPGDPRLRPGTDSFSLSMWVHMSEAIGKYDVAWYNGAYEREEPGYDIELGSGPWKVLVSDGSVRAIAEFGEGSELIDGGWIHLAAVFDRSAGVMRAYVNGELGRSETSQVTITGLGAIAPMRQSMLGKDALDRARFRGVIDEVRLYSFALTPDWIATEHYNLTEPASFMTVHEPEQAPGP